MDDNFFQVLIHPIQSFQKKKLQYFQMLMANTFLQNDTFI